MLSMIALACGLLLLLAVARADSPRESAPLARLPGHHQEINQLLTQRLALLKKVALLGANGAPCSKDRFVFISEHPYGNSGNHIVSLANTLWVAQQMNATLILPEWITSTLKPFNLSVLAQTFCFTLNPAIPKGTVNLEVTSEDSFFAFKLFHQPPFTLPPLSKTTVDAVSAHYVKVYAALWSNPDPSILQAADWLIHLHLLPSLHYSAVHKRSLDGGCGKIMTENTHVSDFDPKELPMDAPEWKGDLRAHHPLCEMTLSFANATMALHGHAGEPLFVAFDGQGDVSHYTSSVFSSVVEGHERHKKTPRKYLDMLVAMHASLFVMNPRSTFSWQIFVVRTVLDLPSVPRLRSDLYLQSEAEVRGADRPLWVSWSSVGEAFDTMRPHLQ
ncbi:hypothetical protein B484DRAFT_162535 [Ochromonadaceae sp. CCMP2298]|nr:hypothetical protein B484DRAFT_162535 [Ochromonadaceae sp. CCMP2298]|mmetsp:Transcript_14918/g.32947  ORF Transcript_14918/g.32947 Transcript_14918/m.32947 type:complete len:388 (-) Transcript_14918:147-1310(-)